MPNSANLEKMVITAYAKNDFTAQVGQPFTVYINPEKYAHDYQIIYNDVQAQGSPGCSPDFNRMGEELINFELVFDGTGVVPAALAGNKSTGRSFTEDGISSQIENFKAVVFSYNGNIHSPNYLKLVWGTLLFSCRMKSLSFNYTLFKPDGTPLRARANAVFVEYTNSVALAKEANKSSPDLSHWVKVVAGDTLPLLCYQIYGSSDYYIEVARANNLTYFSPLTVGRRLIFPPLREQAI